MTALATQRSDLIGHARRSTAAKRRPVPMFGVPTPGRISGRRRINVIAAEMNRPVHLTGAAVAIFNRIADPNDPLGKLKPIARPVAPVPISATVAACG